MIVISETLDRIEKVRKILIYSIPELEAESADRQFDAATRLCNNCGASDPNADLNVIIGELIAFREALARRLEGFEQLPSWRQLQLAVKAWKTDKLIDANT